MISIAFFIHDSSLSSSKSMDSRQPSSVTSKSVVNPVSIPNALSYFFLAWMLRYPQVSISNASARARSSWLYTQRMCVSKVVISGTGMVVHCGVPDLSRICRLERQQEPQHIHDYDETWWLAAPLQLHPCQKIGSWNILDVYTGQYRLDLVDRLYMTVGDQ